MIMTATMMSLQSAALMALAAGVTRVTGETIDISIPSDLSTRALLPDVYGYSIEPIWIDSFTNTSKTKKLFQTIADITGKPPPVRIGGNTADTTYQLDRLDTGNASIALPGLPNAKTFNVTPEWYSTWGDYFPEGTDLIYTLNLNVNTSNFANALAQAEFAHAALGSKLKMFELGNEIDHYINKGWRDSTWGVATYIDQFRNLTGMITQSDWYKATTSSSSSNGSSDFTGGDTQGASSGTGPFLFQAGVFADPPWVPDQHDELDDFDIINITQAGIAQTSAIGGGEADSSIIGSYAMHLYPQSTCDPLRWHRMRLDLLSNHTTLWLNVSQYIPQVAAADLTGHPFVMGETNSVSCGGRSGISDTFGAALWGVDYVLTAASIGIEKVYFHLGGQSEYSSFTPNGYPYKNETLEEGIRAGWYAHYFLAQVVKGLGKEESFGVAALPGANSSSLSGFAVYSQPKEDQGQGREETKTLRKVVLLDMGVYNGTKGLSNPSTMHVTDGTMFTEGQRPSTKLRTTTSWCQGREVKVTRLEAPGTNAKSNVTVAGEWFDPYTAEIKGEKKSETVKVGEKGVVEVDVLRAEGVLLEMEDVSACGGSSGSSGSGGVAGTGDAGRLSAVSGIWLTGIVGGAVFAMML